MDIKDLIVPLAELRHTTDPDELRLAAIIEGEVHEGKHDQNGSGDICWYPSGHKCFEYGGILQQRTEV